MSSRPSVLGSVCVGASKPCSYASSVTRPDGTVYTLGYDTLANGVSKRLRNVVSNRGYALVFEYAGGSPGYVSKACIINLAVTPKPADDVCPAGARSASYGYSGNVQTSATTMDSSGVPSTWAFATPTESSFSLTRPGETAPYVVNSYMLIPSTSVLDVPLAVTSQTFVNGMTYAYNWDIVTNSDYNDGSYTSEVAGGKWTDANSKSVIITYGQYQKQSSDPNGDPNTYVTPGPVLVQDEIGRITRSNYCDTTATTGFCPYLQIPPLKAVIDPEGNQDSYIYTSFRNIYQITRKAKPGSGFSDIVETRNYASSGNANPKTRAKPVPVVDGRLNTVSYSYDPAHGGILSETSPVDANGIQAIKRYAYEQRSAWLSNGAGGYQAAAPVWLLAQERACKSGATTANATGAIMGCAGGASDEVVTTYDYGPNAGPNNLLLRGKVVTANGQSLRTCYQYDAMGNKIAETSPRAGLASCS